MSAPVLITGGAGFIGANLADRLATDGEHVLILDNLSRPGVERNVAWLKRRHHDRVAFHRADIRDIQSCADAVAGAAAVFHFAAQVAVTTSLEQPLEDFSINVRGVLGLLEILRLRAPRTPLIFASTNKVYGDLAAVPLHLQREAYRPVDLSLALQGVNEKQPLDFHTPYGCSKGAADQYVLDYARSFGLSTAVMRMSCVYGPRQMGTEDQGWVAHLLRRVHAGEPISIYGDGRQVRDVLFVEDAVAAYVAAWKQIGAIAGQAFNLGGGPANAVTLLDVIAQGEALFNRRARVFFLPWRAGDQRWYVSDARRVRAALALAEPLPWREGVTRLAGWLAESEPRVKIWAEA
ncbi:CDP-paratose 2-epimerase [Rhodoblastus acidophilus]|uniref:CDP-paratose 2-epimerase n=1 Tax=Rhodoblastus acidophilus TaxID=1074 RepID=A0A212RQL3_RHOAC|nr:SDR family NAD(P)-dependent oxidoreductase [Rhodoblastus acidophilus]PPQ38534.1 CDP-paratose 2-epimerase [Rhodoblastus acidophilus]RAI21847.1 CDP-paratose 2-epimerase [Rhodoblastus acidophilus]SNB74752.1 CDP-paratose 2-epimerase [Rhodoblastus acidophilus]